MNNSQNKKSEVSKRDDNKTQPTIFTPQSTDTSSQVLNASKNTLFFSFLLQILLNNSLFFIFCNYKKDNIYVELAIKFGITFGTTILAFLFNFLFTQGKNAYVWYLIHATLTIGNLLLINLNSS